MVNLTCSIKIRNISSIIFLGVLKNDTLFKSRGRPSLICILHTIHHLHRQSHNPIVIPFLGYVIHLFSSCFTDEGNSDTEIRVKMSGHENWFGTIDGTHCNQAVELFSIEEICWLTFKRFVTIFDANHTLDKYQQFLSIENTRHSEINCFVRTIFDKIDDLRMEYDRLLLNSIEPNHIKFFHQYVRCEKFSGHKESRASIAIIIPF